jgi:signal transduction histidine kinase/ActR/RegA family two-component response regulator
MSAPEPTTCPGCADPVDPSDRYCRSCGKGLGELARLGTELHRNINEGLPVGLILLDARLRIRYWNRTMEAHTSTRRRELLGSALFEALPQLKPYSHRIASVIDTAIPLRLEQVSRGSETGHITEAYWFGPMTLADGTAGILAVMDDVSRRIRVDTQLIRSERLAAIGELAAGVAHNFNNILAAIGGDAQLLKMAAEEERLPEHVREAAQQICEETMRGGRIAHDLLSFARGAAPQMQTLDARSVAEDAVRLIRNHPAVRGSTIEIAIDRPLPEIEADPHLLHQVIFNVMLNALQAMPNGGILTISASLRGHDHDPTQGILDLKFHDTGVGIAREHVRRIFDPFYSKRVGGTAGTGLGLPVSLAMIRSIGGDIRVASAEGIGTTVTLSLPIVERRNETRLGTRSTRGRALVVEADENLGRTLAAVLRRRGFEVTNWGEIASGLTELDSSEGSFRLIVLDWSPCPPSTCPIVRVRAAAPHVPVMALTNVCDPHRLVDAVERGASFVFNKPPNFAELLSAAEQLAPVSPQRTDLRGPKLAPG